MRLAWDSMAVGQVPVGLSGLKHLKTPRRRWKVRASLLNMLASMSVSRSMSTSLHMHRSHMGTFILLDILLSTPGLHSADAKD